MFHVKPTEQGETMSYLKPYTTLAIGIVVGYFVVPKIMAKIGK